MKNILVSFLACASMALAASAADYRQLVTIPSGQTIVTNAVFSGMATPVSGTARLDSYSVGANASITNLTISVRIVGATYTNDITAVSSAAGTALTPAAISVKQVVGTSDYFVLTTVGATNAVATRVYIDMMDP